jgi:hypothetical protein
VQHTRQASERDFEELVATWLGEDRENWPVLCLTLIDPWQERPGIWSEQTPEWVRTLGAIATTAHEKYDPCGRRPTPLGGPPMTKAERQACGVVSDIPRMLAAAGADKRNYHCRLTFAHESV